MRNVRVKLQGWVAFPNIFFNFSRNAFAMLCVLELVTF